ncbi:MAG: hypothetical protein ACRDX8_11775, partial [Acidimicrobiales bacterium]
WLTASNGTVVPFGNAPNHGSTSKPASPLVGMGANPQASGYWLAEATGTVLARGAAKLFSRTGGNKLRTPIVGIAATPDGGGYWLVSAHGGVTSYGDAGAFGSAGAYKLRAPVVGMVEYPGGGGYWVFDSHGDVFNFGAASFQGATAYTKLASPIVAMAPTPSGQGYWLVTRDGVVYSFGDASPHGSTHALGVRDPVTAITADPSGRGYWVLTAVGGVYSFGDASFHGSAGSHHESLPAVALVATENHPAAQTSIFYYPWYGTPTDLLGRWRHWDEGGHSPPLDIGSDFYPQLGAYSSADPSAVSAQMGEIANAGVNEVISSWWGQGSYEDQRLPLIAQQVAANHLTLAVEIEPYAGRTPAGVASDISYLRANFGVSDFFVYQASNNTAGAWRAAVAPLGTGVRIFAAGNPDDMITGSFDTFAAAAGFEGIYTYDPYELDGADFAGICGAARMHGLLCSPSVSPGFRSLRAEHVTNVKPRDGGKTYDNSWAGALAANPDQVSITSFNEWHEGSQIEPDQPLCLPASKSAPAGEPVRPGYCYQTYSGAYGVTGTASENAYLDRTLYWTQQYRAAY